MIAQSLDRIGLNVASLEASLHFYTGALGFIAGPILDGAPEYAALLGARALRVARLTRGGQAIELTQCDPPGAPYPAGSRSNDLWFQHCALATADMAGAASRLQAYAPVPISINGPQTLPGGIVAFKFRDPDGHPLELIQFPHPNPATAGGIDHSAIAVADIARSVAFYAATLGLGEQARQVNTGPAQDALDGLDGVQVDVVALAPRQAAPHVELLGYRTPPGRLATGLHPSDIAAGRLVFRTGGAPALHRDPDGHVLITGA